MKAWGTAHISNICPPSSHICISSTFSRGIYSADQWRPSSGLIFMRHFVFVGCCTVVNILVNIAHYFQQVRRRVYFYSATKLTQIIILITYNLAVTIHSLLLMVGTVISKLIYYDSYTLLGRLTTISTKACHFYGDFSKHLNSGILIETNNDKL